MVAVRLEKVTDSTSLPVEAVNPRKADGGNDTVPLNSSKSSRVTVMTPLTTVTT